MASRTQDDAFHEIQLNGKQLVFLFMAATVVSVVIFLCGVLVGRGVRAERGVAADLTAADAVADLRAGDLAGPMDTSAPAAGDPTEAAPPPAVDELSYFNRLESKDPAPEDLKMATAPAAETPASTKATPAVTSPPAKVPASRPAASQPPARTATEPTASAPTGRGYTLQIAALRDRGEANAMADRLTAKGYGAYVVTPANGAPQVYRVRVGRYSTRREAEAVAAKLQREEQFTPWITR